MKPPTAAELAVYIAQTDWGPIRCTWSPGCTHSAIAWTNMSPTPLDPGGLRKPCVHHLADAQRTVGKSKVFALLAEPLPPQ